MKEKESSNRAAKEEFLKMCEGMDADSDGHLSLEELLRGFRQSNRFAETLRLLDVGEEDLSNLFHLMDEDHSGHVSYKEFCDQLQAMRSNDTHTVLFFLKHHVAEVRYSLLSEMGAMQKQMNQKI